MEKKLLALCLQSTENLIAVQEKGLTRDHFSAKENGQLLYTLLWYFRQYKALITEDALKTTLAHAGNIDNDSKNKILAVYYEVLLEKPLEPVNALIDYVIKEYKARSFKNLLRDSIDNLSPDRVDNTLSLFLKECNKLNSLTKKINREGYYNVNVQDRLDAYTERKGKNYIGITYGITQLDNATGGHLPGELWIILGKEKSGKTTVMLNMANNAWLNGNNVVYFSAEVSKSVIERRLDGLNSGISVNGLKRGTLNPTEEQKYKENLSIIQKRNNIFYVVDRPGMSTDFIKAKIQELKLQFPVDLVVVDYTGIIQLPWNEPSERERIGRVAWELRDIGALENVPMLTAHQMNRQGDVGNSIDVGRHCDLMLDINVKDPDEKKHSPVCTLSAEIRYARDSEQRSFEVYAEFGKMQIRDPEMQHAAHAISRPAENQSVFEIPQVG